MRVGLSREMRTSWALVAVLLLLQLPLAVHTQCAIDFFGSGCQSVYNVQTVAGFLGVTGFVNGALQVSRVKTVTALALDGSGNVWFADGGNAAVRILNVSTGNVSTFLAGGAFVAQPTGLAFDSAGNLWSSDIGISGTSPYIRRFDVTTGVASAAAGSGGAGTTAGFGSSAAFRYPRGLTFDGSGNLVRALVLDILLLRARAYACLRMRHPFCARRLSRTPEIM